MSSLDWMVLISATVFIVAYGIWKTRKNKNIDAYLMGGHTTRWWTVGLSVMATQASAITFLSTPGQAFDDGLRSVLFWITYRHGHHLYHFYSALCRYESDYGL